MGGVLRVLDGGLNFARSLGNANAKIELEGEARAWGAEAMRPEDLEGLVQYLEGSALVAQETEYGPSQSIGGAIAHLSFMGDLQADALRQGVLNFILTAQGKAKKGGKGGAKINFKGTWGYVWRLDGTEPGDIIVESKSGSTSACCFGRGP